MPRDQGREDEPSTIVDASGTGRFGRYRLVHQLGSGGMATVWLARVEGPGGFERAVAIKRIHPHLAEIESFVEMFLDEARIASSISHPNVCSVQDVGEIGGVYYLAMEYLVGETLGSIMKTLATEHPDELASRRWRAFAARLIADACEGLHAAHVLTDAHGRPLDVVHRDVSPSNLFVTYDGAMKVMDFGIATARGRLHQTREGAIKGKLEYLAPEAFQAKGTIDRRFDVWSLGVCLWEALTGQRLFKRGGDMAAIQAVRADPILAPSNIQPAVEPALDAIVLRALERDPARRYQSARELGQALGDYVARAPQRVGLAEVAEWMQSRYRQEHTSKLALLDRVRRGAIAEPVDDQRTEIDRVAPPDRSSDDESTPRTRTVAPGQAPGDEDPTLATPSPESEFDEPATISLSGSRPGHVVTVPEAISTVRPTTNAPPPALLLVIAIGAAAMIGVLIVVLAIALAFLS